MPRVRLSTGLRLNVTAERRGEGETSTHTRPSGSLGAIVSVWERGEDHVNLYGDYRNTFKPAAFDFSLAENEGVLDPETASSIEGGVKVRALNQRITPKPRCSAWTSRTSSRRPSSTDFRRSSTRERRGSRAWSSPATPTAATGVSGRATYSFHDATFVDFVQAFDGVPTQLAGNGFEMSARHLVVRRSHFRACQRHHGQPHRQAHRRPILEQAQYGARRALHDRRCRRRLPLRRVRDPRGWA